MNLAEQLRLLQAAQGDPAKLALATVELKYPGLPQAERARVKASLEAAAIPHWCDATILAALLEISLEESAALLRQLRGLTVVEPFLARGNTALNVHEAARLALRKSLASREADRFRVLSARAERHFETDLSPAGRIERMFHRLWLDPERAGPEIEQMELDLRHKVEDGLALAASLHECVSDESAPPLVQCWACWTVGTVEAPYLKIGKRLELASRALHCAEAASCGFASATAGVLVADVLFERGQAGDAKKVLDHYQRSLEIYERLLKANPESAQAARDVSVSVGRLGDFLASRGQPGDAKKALGYYQRSLGIYERLLKANPESAQAARDYVVALDHMAQRHADNGQANLALKYFEQAKETLERLLKANPESAQAARDVSVSVGRLGDLLESRGQAGDAKKALGYYQRCLKLDERLLKANPESAQAARDVSVSVGQLGDFLASRGEAGDAKKALGYYQRCLEIYERLLKANPESALAARDVSSSVGRLADFLESRGQPGDAEKALGYYQRSLGIYERLLKANPESAQAARDVSTSVGRLADFLESRGQPGDAKKALGYYQRSLGIYERLLKANPESAQAARDVSVCVGQLADFLESRGQAGDAKKALGYYQRCLKIDERLLKANPESAQAARDVSVSVGRLGDFLESRGQAGDAKKALGYYQRCLKIYERLLKANPESAQAARDVSVRVGQLADFLARRGQAGDAKKALGYYQWCLKIDERLLKANPESAQAARDVSVSVGRLGGFLESRGQPGDAKKALGYYQRCLEICERLLKANPESAQAARDVSISHFKLLQFHRRSGEGKAKQGL
jgi:tetratricopeptide (TPR) repeat protein